MLDVSSLELSEEFEELSLESELEASVSDDVFSELELSVLEEPELDAIVVVLAGGLIFP